MLLFGSFLIVNVIILTLYTVLVLSVWPNDVIDMTLLFYSGYDNCG